MSDKWNGVPLNPEQRRWHWLSWQGEEPGLYEWVGQYWIMGGGNPPLDYVAEHFTYLGPSLTPAEVDARVKDALKWRDAINAALTNWLCPIEDHETPADAMQRLIRLEVMAALDPAVSKSAADLVAAARKEWLAELNHDTDALMEAARDSALAECIAACDAIVYSYRVGLPEKHKDRPGGIPYSWKEMWENSAEIAEDIIADIRVLSDTPPGTMSGQLAKQDLRAADCIKQWPECESGAYDPRCCRFPKSCSCESGELKGEGND
jgi:hypothetical protein